MKLKQILAIIAIVLLVAMYGITLVFAIFDNPNTLRLLGLSFGATIFIPVLLWVVILIYNNRKRESESIPAPPPPSQGAAYVNKPTDEAQTKIE